MVWQESERASEEVEEVGDADRERAEGKERGVGEVEKVERAGRGGNGEAELGDKSGK